MKVLLTEDVDTLGYKGEIFEVSDGYGRNFLIPQGFAVPATPGQLKMAAKWRELASARRDQLRKEHQALAERLVEIEVSFVAKAGDKGRLYGSITTADIAAKIQEDLGIELDRRKVSVAGKAIRQTGDHLALVRLDADYQANVTVHVLSEEDAANAEAEAVEAEVVEAESEEEAPAEEAADDAVEAVEAVGEAAAEA
ncbi:MAG: 50S ribosomal protein L9 [Ardenticatenaceae bacterium]|nr:50S ribosomal protein L9 [Ardenticatenaceae bacterium]